MIPFGLIYIFACVAILTTVTIIWLLAIRAAEQREELSRSRPRNIQQVRQAFIDVGIYKPADLPKERHFG